MVEARLAVSEVVGSLLMLVIVVALASIVLTTVSGWVSVQRGSVLPAVRESFIVEDVWFHVEGGRPLVTVTFYNYGDIPVTLVRVYLNGSAVWDGRFEVKPGVSRSLDVEYGWRAGGVYTLIFYTERGNVVRVWEKAPGG